MLKNSPALYQVLGGKIRSNMCEMIIDKYYAKIVSKEAMVV